MPTLKNVIDIILKTHSQFSSTFNKEELKFIQFTNYENYHKDSLEAVELNPSFSFEQCDGGFYFLGTLLYYMDNDKANILTLLVSKINSSLKHGKIITRIKDEIIECKYRVFIAWELIEKDTLHYKEFLSLLDKSFYEYGHCSFHIENLSKTKSSSKEDETEYDSESEGLYEYLAQLEKKFNFDDNDDDDESDCTQ